MGRTSNCDDSFLDPKASFTLEYLDVALNLKSKNGTVAYVPSYTFSMRDRVNFLSHRIQEKREAAYGKRHRNMNYFRFCEELFRGFLVWLHAQCRYWLYFARDEYEYRVTCVPLDTCQGLLVSKCVSAAQESGMRIAMVEGDAVSITTPECTVVGTRTVCRYLGARSRLTSSDPDLAVIVDAALDAACEFAAASEVGSETASFAMRRTEDLMVSCDEGSAEYDPPCDTLVGFDAPTIADYAWDACMAWYVHKLAEEDVTSVPPMQSPLFTWYFQTHRDAALQECGTDSDPEDVEDRDLQGSSESEEEEGSCRMRTSATSGAEECD